MKHKFDQAKKYIKKNWESLTTFGKIVFSISIIGMIISITINVSTIAAIGFLYAAANLCKDILWYLFILAPTLFLEWDKKYRVATYAAVI